EEALDDRESKRRGLARARLGETHDVSPFEDERDGLRLNWRRLEVSRITNGVENRAAEAKGSKALAVVEWLFFDYRCCHELQQCRAPGPHTRDHAVVPGPTLLHHQGRSGAHESSRNLTHCGALCYIGFTGEKAHDRLIDPRVSLLDREVSCSLQHQQRSMLQS